MNCCAWYASKTLPCCSSPTTLKRPSTWATASLPCAATPRPHFPAWRRSSTWLFLIHAISYQPKSTPTSCACDASYTNIWGTIDMAGTLFRWLRPLVFPALLIGALEIYTRRVTPNSDALAPPSEALSAFIDALFNGDIISATGFTLMSAGLGLALACIAGIGLGIVLGLSPR